MLERQAGVLFYGLFNMVLFVLHQQTKPALAANEPSETQQKLPQS
jgi:hypothetical protein